MKEKEIMSQLVTIRKAHVEGSIEHTALTEAYGLIKSYRELQGKAMDSFQEGVAHGKSLSKKK